MMLLFLVVVLLNFTIDLRLRLHGLRVKPEKWRIAVRHISFLGHVVSGSGIMPDPEKIEAVNNISSPRSIKDIRSFVGLASYYRKFIPGFSSIAAPLTIDARSGELYLDECMRTRAIFKTGNGESGNREIGESGNWGIRESGNPGIGESGNRGIREYGNQGIGESGNQGTIS